MNNTTKLLADGIAAFKQDDFKGAIASLEAVTMADKRNFSAFIYLGAAYAAVKRYNAAIGAFKLAEELKPNAASVHYNLGQAYEAAGVPYKALFEYQRALDLDKRYGLARGALIALEKKLLEAKAKRMAA